ncbi:MAG: hypothetical protein ACRC6R_08420 [Bacteroidales bacterium]
MASIREIIFNKVGEQYHSTPFQINRERCTIALTTQSAGTITMQRSYNGVAYAPVTDLNIEAASGNTEFGLSDIVPGQFIKIISTVPIIKAGLLS